MLACLIQSNCYDFLYRASKSSVDVTNACIFKFSCPIEISFFPFDNETVRYDFGPGLTMDLL
jgi:hypothetical protein